MLVVFLPGSPNINKPMFCIEGDHDLGVGVGSTYEIGHLPANALLISIGKFELDFVSENCRVSVHVPTGELSSFQEEAR